MNFQLIFKIIITFIFFLPLNIIAGAVAYNWKNVIIGGGGFVTGIIYHPAESGLVYARTDMGGAYRWDSSLNRWVAITDMMNRTNSNYMGILSIALDPTDTNRVYMMTGKYTDSWAGNGAVLVSTNRGNSWTIVPLSFKVGGNEEGRGCGERLAVDPNLPSVLFMGSGGDDGGTSGLWKSTNYGSSWSQVTSFNTTANINFVIFDKSSSSSGSATQRIFIGVKNTGGQSLYVSTNGGSSWSVVSGQPSGLMAIRADIASGYLYTTWANSAGPNNATSGAVWRYQISNGTWTNITPASGSYGYSGISVDAQNPNHIIVCTLDLWWPLDQVWRSTNGGSSWTYLMWNPSNNQVIANFDRSYAPWTSIRTPHWLADIKIDPFNSNKAMFVTGYGIWACDNISAATTTWYFKDNVLEEMVPIEIISPPSGALLLSANGDQGVFRHDNLDASPASGVALNVGTSLSIDYAEGLPSKIVAAFNTSPYGAYSTNGGTSWTNFSSYPSGATAGGSKAIAISADGNRIVWAPSNAQLSYSTNNGASWTTCGGGAPAGYWPESDRVNSNKFYYYDPVNGRLWVSTNGGTSFTQMSTAYPTLPSWQSYNGSVNAVFGREGDIWITTGAGGLYHSTDSGTSATKVNSVTEAYLIGFGMASTGGTYPAIYLHGIVGGVLGIFRSDDGGSTWSRINTDSTQFGWLHCIKGDQRTYGRCYVSAEGRGVLYGDPAGSTGSPTFTPTRTRTPTTAATSTYTRTRTPTYTRTSTGTPTRTNTTAATSTFTFSRTATSTFTRTATPTRTNTAVISSTFTSSRTASPTFTRTASPTFTHTPTGTNTTAATPTFTSSRTATSTYTRTASPTLTRTPTGTNTSIPTNTFTLTRTSTFTYTRTATSTFTRTISPTHSVSPTITQTLTGTQPSPTNTPTITPSRTITVTMTYTRTSTPTYTRTNTAVITNTLTGTPTRTATQTFTATPSLTYTVTLTRTTTFSYTQTNTQQSTSTFTFTQTATGTMTRTYTLTSTMTASYTRTNTPNYSPTQTWTGTPPSPTNTPTITNTSSLLPTSSSTPTRTWTNTYTRTTTATYTQTNTPYYSPTQTPTNIQPTSTNTSVITNTFTRTTTSTYTSTVTYTQTRTNSPTFTVTDTISSNTPTATPTYTMTSTRTATSTDTVTNTMTATRTITQSYTETTTNTSTNTATGTSTMTRTATRTWTMTATLSWTRTITTTITNTPSITATNTVTPTFTGTVIPDKEEFKIEDVVIMPNPYNPGRSDIKIGFEITQASKVIKVRIYTSGFRLIKQITQVGNYVVGRNTIDIESRYLNNLANGAYYIIITAINNKGVSVNSKPSVLIILK